MFDSLKFALKNLNRLKENPHYSYWKTLALINNVLNGKIKDDVILNNKQKAFMIDFFIETNRILDNKTPDFIKEDRECIKSSIKNDANSIKYAKLIDDEIKSFAINEAIRQEIILNANSPRIFVNNYDVVMQSIKKNINSVEFAKSEIRNSLPVFRYLVLNNYHFDGTYLKSRTLDYMNDFNVLKKSLKLINKNCYDEKYLEKFAEIYYGVINSKPLIKDFESIFQYIAELKWKEKKEDTIGIYVNVFGKIISELKSASQFEEVFSHLSLLTQEMKNILEEKYDLLYANMLEYYNIFHSQTTNKLQKIAKSRNVISKLSSLYIAKSKENYKKEIMEECNKCIEKYYQLKLTNPYINKIISLPLKKKEFKKLYKGKSQEVCLFLEEISRKYSHSLKNIDVWQLINGFVLNNYSNLEDIIKVPNHFDNYQRFVKASKLINRLNSGYISYDNQELLKYKDIIKFSEDENKYIYTGITFSSNDLEIFKEYLRISKIFAKNKKRDYDENFINEFEI